MSTAGYTVDFVGTQSLAPATGGSDGEHDGYADARIDAADSASNSLSGRVSAIRTAVGAVDIVILSAGWADALAGTSSVATKFDSLLAAIRSGTWAGAKVAVLTMSPAPNKTEAQTGSDYPVFATLNAAIRASAGTDVAIVDLAALTTGGSSAAMIETLLFDAQNAPDYSSIHSGGAVPAYFGGHLVTSFKSMQDFNANWSVNVARDGNGNPIPPPGGDRLKNPDTRIQGHPAFINSVQAVVPWFWCFAAPGHDAPNTVIETRNLFAQALRGSTGQWEFFFEGARTGADGLGDFIQWVDGGNDGKAPPHPSALSGARPDGITSFYRPWWNTGYECWAVDTVPTRGVQSFVGGTDRGLMVDAIGFCWGVQVRLALLDPAGENDMARARLFAACGADFSAANGQRHYDYLGWPLGVQDGGHDRWKRIASTEWVWVGGIPIGDHWNDAGTPPPLGPWSPPTPYNNAPTYSRVAAEIRSNPPRLPRYVSGVSTGSASAWIATDFWLNPSTGSRALQWSQQGADRAARAIFDSLVATGWLATFVGTGPVAPSLLPGIPRIGAWFARLVTESTTPDTATWTGIAIAEATAPVWPNPISLPPAVIGVPWVASVVASGVPAPSYTKVSGSAWIAYNATTGELTGTPVGPEGVESVVLRATNTAAPAGVDLALQLRVTSAPVILTTTLPNAVQGQDYYVALEYTGAEPVAFATTAGTISAGLELVGPVISGRSTTLGAASFSITPSGPGGTGSPRAFTLTTVAAPASGPAWTTSTLPGGTTGSPTVTTVAATGATGYSVPYFSGSGTATITSGGVLTIPSQSVAGTFAITLRATNAGGAFTDRTFTFAVTPPQADPAPVRTWIGPDGGGVSWQRGR